MALAGESPLFLSDSDYYFDVHRLDSTEFSLNCGHYLISEERKQKYLAELEEVMEFVNQHFRRRGWTEEMLKERFPLAAKFAHLSNYVYLRSKKTGPSFGKIVGVIGVSWAEYTREKKGYPLPGEDSLHTRWPRPDTSLGNGTIFEMRSWAIDNELLTPEERRMAFTQLFINMWPTIEKRVSKYADIHLQQYDQPIIYTYGDETSLRLYGPMGFKVVGEPAEHAGTKWWTLAITPRELEQLVRRTTDIRFMNGLGQAIEMNFSGNKVAVERFGDVLIPRKGPYLTDDKEVLPGIWGKKGTYLEWADESAGKLSTITLAMPYEVLPGVIADEGSLVIWVNGCVEYVGKVKNSPQVEPGRWAVPGASLRYYNCKFRDWSFPLFPGHFLLQNQN